MEQVLGFDENFLLAFRGEIKEIFDKVDLDRSGVVEKNEFVEALISDPQVHALASSSRLLSGLVAAGELAQAFESCKAAGKSAIEFEDFWQFCREQADDESIRAMFNAIDANNNRSISCSEIATAFRTNAHLREIAARSKVFGPLLHDGNWERLLAEMDTAKAGDEQGWVGYVDFWNWCNHLAAQIQINAAKAKARAATIVRAQERRVTQAELLKRVRLHTFKHGAGRGGISTISISPDHVNFHVIVGPPRQSLLSRRE